MGAVRCLAELQDCDDHSVETYRLGLWSDRYQSANHARWMRADVVGEPGRPSVNFARESRFD